MGKMTVHIYTVQRGESARSVCEKFNVSAAALLRENETPFYEGQQVTVPVGVLNLPQGTSAGRLTGSYQVSRAAIIERDDAVNIIFL